MDNFYAAFAKLEQDHPLDQRIDPNTYQPVMDGIDPASGVRTAPMSVQTAQYYNTDRYMEPYVSQFFGSSIAAVEAFEEPGLVPVIDRRIDPNKIFNADIQAMKTLAADQVRIVKLFEKKLQESLSEKGKFGLTEDDINAMQALTSARAAVANINKEQVNIKKTIADIRIKQQQNRDANQAAGNNGVPGRNPYDSNDIGRSMLDDLFNSAVSVYEPTTQQSDYSDAVDVDPSKLDAILPKVGDNIEAEVKDGKVWVEVTGPDNSTAKFAGYSLDGSVEKPDYPLPGPEVKITDIDRDAHQATDNLGRTYEIKEIHIPSVE